MNFIDQLDPELRLVVEKLPTDRPINLNQIATARIKMKKMVTAMLASLPAVDGVSGADQPWSRAAKAIPMSGCAFTGLMCSRASFPRCCGFTAADT